MAAPTNLKPQSRLPRQSIIPRRLRTGLQCLVPGRDRCLGGDGITVFANGNNSNCGYSSPPGLNTVGSGPLHNVTSVGSTGRSDGQYAPHSNWGPTDDAKVFHSQGYPQSSRRWWRQGWISSAAGSDDRVCSLEQNSMSAPHVTGPVALMWGSAKTLLGDVAATTDLIWKPPTHPLRHRSGGWTDLPNHATGWGEIDARRRECRPRLLPAGI